MLKVILGRISRIFLMFRYCSPLLLVEWGFELKKYVDERESSVDEIVGE